MKKEYISPIADVMFIETKQMIAASTLESNPTGNTVSVDFTDEEYDGEGASRRRNVWDEEEEAEF